jgi:L-amino acid N-acyltransferase YncA
LAQRLIDEARKSGYSELYLDSADFMSSAHSLYRSLGFRDVDAYPEAGHPQDVLPHVIYMALALD